MMFLAVPNLNSTENTTMLLLVIYKLTIICTTQYYDMVKLVFRKWLDTWEQANIGWNRDWVVLWNGVHLRVKWPRTTWKENSLILSALLKGGSGVHTWKNYQLGKACKYKFKLYMQSPVKSRGRDTVKLGETIDIPTLPSATYRSF